MMDNNDLYNLCKEVENLKNKDPEMGKEMAEKLYKAAKALQNREYMYQALYLQGMCCINLGSPYSAIDFYNQSLQLISTEFPHDAIKHYGVNNALGFIYFQLDQQAIALHYFFEALKYKPELGGAKILHNIAAIYSINEDFERALYYSEEASKAAKEVNDNITLSNVLLNSATALVRLGKTKRAREKLEEATYYLKSIEGNNSISDIAIINRYITAAEIYLKDKELDKASIATEKAMEEIEKTNNLYFYSSTLYLKAKILLEQKEDDKSISTALSALEYSKSHALPRETNQILHFLIDYHKEKEDWENAFHYMSQLSKVTDEIIHKTKEENYKKIIHTRRKEISEIAHTNHEIKKQNTVLDQLSGILSHNISESIQDILTFSQLLEKKYGTKMDEEGKEFMQYITKGANHMNLNFTRFLEFASLQELDSSQIESINVHELSTKLQAQYQEKIAPYQIHVSVSSPFELQMVPEHAYMLFHELFANAVKFRKTQKDCRINIEVIKIRNHYAVSFTDYGIGIELEYHEKVFKLFGRLDKKKEGAGIGLAICHRIVQLYHGNIKIESNFGQSTTIYFSIPTQLVATK